MLTTTPKTKDEKHKNMINGFIKTFSDISRFDKFETEYKFNYYGDRGYIDLLTVEKFNQQSAVVIYEFKTSIFDVGDTIRQVKKYSENTRRIYKNSIILCSVVMYDTSENIQRFRDNMLYYYSSFNAFLDDCAFVVMFVERENMNKYRHVMLGGAETTIDDMKNDFAITEMYNVVNKFKTDFVKTHSEKEYNNNVLFVFNKAHGDPDTLSGLLRDTLKDNNKNNFLFVASAIIKSIEETNTDTHKYK